MLDRLPTWARDLLLMIAASLLGWVSSDLVPLLHDQGGAAALLAPVLVVVVNALTPLTRAYTLSGEKPVDGGGSGAPTDTMTP